MLELGGISLCGRRIRLPDIVSYVGWFVKIDFVLRTSFTDGEWWRMIDVFCVV